MAKVLFFFTASYPYGTGETFIENEIEYLAKAFDKIVIISNDITNDQTRRIPEETTLYRLSYNLPKFQKLIAYKNIFSHLFWQELKIIHKIYKIIFANGILNTMCQTIQKSRFWHSRFQNIINNESKQTDQIYLYSYWNNDVAFAIDFYKQKHKTVKAFSRMHGWDVYFEANAISYLPFRSFLFENLDSVFAISQKGKDYYKKWFPRLQEKIDVSHLGTRQYGLNPESTMNELHIITISNTIAIKNLEMFVEALALLDIDFHWTHFGDGVLQETIRIKAEKFIPGKFHLNGRIPNHEIMSYLKKFPIDLFANVSLSEGIPVSIMEAMSFGIPCIATAVGGTPEIVNNENGILLSQKTNPEEIANSILSFYHLPTNKKMEKRKMAFKTWKEKYNAEKNYTDFCKQILA